MNPAKKFGLVRPSIELVPEVQSVRHARGGVEAAWRNGRRLPLKTNEIVELQFAREDCRKRKTARVSGGTTRLIGPTHRQFVL
jgi:hypothetical protein